MSKSRPIESIPFTNELEQVIQPGDNVLIVTQSTGNLGVRKGKYIGLRQGDGKYIYESVVVEIQQPIEEWRHKVTNELMKLDVPGTNGLPRRPQTWDNKYGTGNHWSPIKRNQTPEQRALYEADMAKYHEESVAYNKLFEAYKAEHHLVVRIRTHRRALQCNRIFPLGN